MFILASKTALFQLPDATPLPNSARDDGKAEEIFFSSPFQTILPLV